jgi:anti-sigma-K factor RskA
LTATLVTSRVVRLGLRTRRRSLSTVGLSSSRSRHSEVFMRARDWRWAIAAANVLAMAAIVSAVQVSDSASATPCVKRLLVPSYPLVARSSNSSATLSVDLKLNIDGTVQSQQFEVIHDSKNRSLFQGAIERAVKVSEFAPVCGGQTVRLTFRFKMGGADAVWFEYPGTYEITALPLPLNVSGPKKRPAAR